MAFLKGIPNTCSMSELVILGHNDPDATPTKLAGIIRRTSRVVWGNYPPPLRQRKAIIFNTIYYVEILKR